ncbi:molybdopterin molybdotransferase MoeA [Methylomarinum vadi]|uniref:molybdopterin molybdotransferase MoeA n=1 Tax=Methylomarinum vadi TaxID=438855 RepID=UPI0004DF65E8|nr:gephyrin-like molybdotransferase Glp [Methylomarinum vadi]
MKDDCNPNDVSLLSVEQALRQIHHAIYPVSDQEKLPLSKAFGRILAEPVTSPIDIPPNRVASMDGYALSSNDIIDKASFSLTNVGISWAGKPFAGNIKSGQCVRILTGAVLPNDADSVVMQEIVAVKGEHVVFPPQTQGLQNIRAAGSDIMAGSELLAAGKMINACECALLASAGIHEVAVKRKLNLAFLSTGNELTAIGTPLEKGHIYDSNRYALAGLLKDERFNVSDLGVIGDDKARLQQVLVETSHRYDAIITTGGASVGDADYIHDILEHCGQVNLWKIAMKPGKPLIFGKMNECLLFGLSGNPVSAIVMFQQIVHPALQYLSGAAPRKTLRLKATCICKLKKSPGRQEYQRGILTQLDNGEFVVDSAGRQDSHQLSALSKANCYIVLPAECNGIEAGQLVVVEPMTSKI